MRGLPLLLLLAASVCHAQLYPGSPGPENNLITVDGDAEVLVAPNQVEILVGIESRDPKLAAANADNTRRLQTALAAARSAGVAPADLKSDFFEVQPVYRSDTNEQFLSGPPPIRYWQVRKNLAIALRDPSKYEQLLTALLDNGITHVHRTTFSTTELKVHRDRARELAVLNATSKAKGLAAAAKRQIVEPAVRVHLTRSWDGASHGYWNQPGYGGYAMNSQTVVRDAASGGPGNVALGRISVSAAVSLTFRLAPIQ